MANERLAYTSFMSGRGNEVTGEFDEYMTKFKMPLTLILYRADEDDNKRFPKRKNQIRIIISTYGNPLECPKVEELYDNLSSYLKDSPRWYLMKYKPRNSFRLGELGKLTLKAGDMDVSVSDIKYFAIIDTKSKIPKLSLILFAKKEIINLVTVINSKVSPPQRILASGNFLYILITFILGEYDMLHTISNIQVADIETITITSNILPLSELAGDVDRLNKMAYEGAGERKRICSGCKISNCNVKLRRCCDTFYCDIICQRSDFGKHKKECKKIKKV